MTDDETLDLERELYQADRKRWKVIDSRRPLLNQLLHMGRTDVVELNYESAEKAANVRYNLYAMLKKLKENPDYNDYEYAELVDNISISWRRSETPGRLIITKRTATSKDFKNVPILVRPRDPIPLPNLEEMFFIIGGLILNPSQKARTRYFNVHLETECEEEEILEWVKSTLSPKLVTYTRDHMKHALRKKPYRVISIGVLAYEGDWDAENKMLQLMYKPTSR